VDERPRLGVTTNGWGVPEGTTEVDPSELVGIDVSVDARSGAGAVVVEIRELMAADRLEVVLDGVLASCNVGTEPGIVSRRAVIDTRNVSVGVVGIGLSVSSGGVEYRLLVPRAAEENPLVADAGDGKSTREVNLSSILNGGMEILEGAVGIDIGE